MTLDLASTPQTIGALLRWTRQVLARAGISNQSQEPLWLLEYALDMRRHDLLSETDRALTPELWTRARSLIGRRAAYEPLQYLLGTQEFCGLEFEVNSDVLIPRPETELLVQEVVRRADLHRRITLVDVGTGSGCLAISLATVLPCTRILAIDQSPQALAVARRNGLKHGVSDKIEWLEGNLLSPLSGQDLMGTLDVILSNPPYISEADWAELQPEVRLFEPRPALVGGPIGTEVHERLLRESRKYLAPGGWLVMEVGQWQAAVVRDMADAVKGYGTVEVVQDPAGIERVVIARRSE